MTTFVPTRFGQVNGAGDDRALFLKVFGGETVSAFNRNQAFVSRHKVKTLTSGS